MTVEKKRRIGDDKERGYWKMVSSGEDKGSGGEESGNTKEMSGKGGKSEGDSSKGSKGRLMEGQVRGIVRGH